MLLIKMKTIIIAFLYNFLYVAYGSNILVVMPFPAYSHTNSYIPIFKELAKRGHNVTMVSPFPLKEPIPNYKDIVLKNTWEEVMKSIGPQNLRGKSFLKNIMGIFWSFCDTFWDPLIEMPEFVEFLNDKNSEYDLIILESFFCQQSLLALGHKYRAPVVTVVTISMTPSLSKVAGNPHPAAYIPDMRLAYSDHMTFWQRVENTLLSVSDVVVSEIHGYNKMDKFMRTHFSKYPGFDNLPPLTEMQSNVSLYLVDNHFSLNYPRPHIPNIVEFGGLSLKMGEKLPANLEKFMNESKDGVIFFTWGSHFQMTNMKPELLSAFMSVFGKLKQRVLMKWENKTIPGKPDNVEFDKWFPQASILSHPNLRLFISHCGLHGTSEAIYNAVPILGTPLFHDQDFNIQMALQARMALSIDIDTADENELYTKIKRLLEDPSFKENAVKKSLIMKDRPLSALDNAVYWVEYVLRHKGAHHLRPGSLKLTWYQNMLLDVIAFILSVVILSLVLLVYVMKLLCKVFKKKGDKKCIKGKKFKEN